MDMNIIKTHYGKTVLAKIQKLEPDDGRNISQNRLIKYTCSWRDKLIVFWTMKRKTKYFYVILQIAL